MTRTFLDSGVLLTAWRGKGAEAALAILDDASREFVTSQLVKLELLPKPAFFKQQAELDFYQTHFSMVKAEEELSEELGRDAFRLAQQYGVSAADALHLAAAFRLKAVEFVTSELPGKPMFRVPGIKITSIHRAH